MNVLAWNCRGLNDAHSPTIPYLRWLLQSYRPAFLFLQETKTNVQSVAHVLHATNPVSFCGVDAIDSRGGLAVFCWGPYDMEVVMQCSNYILCKISSINGKMWHCLFLYGAPQADLRPAIWNDLTQILRPFTKYIIIGDINQVDSYGDKMGGAPLIRGWEDIQNWKHDLHLVDIPFYGPRYTWTNNLLDSALIMERLDRAYASQDWLDEFPSTTIQNFPILNSDHAPIWLQTSPMLKKLNRPYQLES